MTPETISITDQASTFKLLSDETRLKALLFIQGGEKNVTQICEHLGQSQPAVSHHLALLRVSGLVEARRDAKNNYYSICRDRLRETTALVSELTGRVKRKGA